MFGYRTVGCEAETYAETPLPFCDDKRRCGCGALIQRYSHFNECAPCRRTRAYEAWENEVPDEEYRKQPAALADEYHGGTLTEMEKVVVDALIATSGRPLKEIITERRSRVQARDIRLLVLLLNLYAKPSSIRLASLTGYGVRSAQTTLCQMRWRMKTDKNIAEHFKNVQNRIEQQLQ